MHDHLGPSPYECEHYFLDHLFFLSALKSDQRHPYQQFEQHRHISPMMQSKSLNLLAIFEDSDGLVIATYTKKRNFMKFLELIVNP